MTEVRQPAALRIAKGAALMLTAALWAAAMARLAVAASAGAAAAAIPALAGGALLGYLAADLWSGLVHWCCDTFFDEHTPLVGRRVIAPFREHHRDPRAITRYGLLDQDGTSYVAAAPMLAIVLAVPPDPAAPLGIGAHAAACAFAAGMAATNLFHKWAHTDAPPRLIAWLQRRRVVLPPASHARHHRAHDRAYCVTSGWLNPLLDRLQVFARLERAVRACQGRRRDRRLRHV